MTHDVHIEPHLARSALVTIDMQNDFALEGAPARIAGTLEIIPNLARLLQAYRSAGLPIVHVIRLYYRDGSNADRCRKKRIEEGTGIVAPGSHGSELLDGIGPSPAARLDAEKLLSGSFQAIGSDEHIMYKPRWGAFYQTPLEAFLQSRAVDTLVFAGCNYPNCPRTSIYEASERDFRTVLVDDAVSQLTAKDREEMTGIGVSLFSTGAIEQALT